MRDEVVLIRQFRAGAYVAGHHPLTWEAVAGIIEANETAEAMIRREAVEEAGLQIAEVMPIANIMLTPGACSESCQVFLGRIDTTRAGGVFGLESEGEDILVKVLPFAEAYALVERNEVDNAVGVIALQWLALHRDEVRKRWRLSASARRLLPSCPGASAGRESEQSMNVRSGFIDSIGNTPLIKLKAASAATGCDIYGKAEFLNPGGSVKDRAALAMIEDAEKRGALRKGGVVVEGTAGNTGIGIALVANARGYRSVIVMPETQSQEKKDMLRLCGADLRLVPALPYANPGNYVRYSETLAKEIAAKEPNGAIWANQFDNVANRDGHYRTTGPEICEQTDGKVAGFTCSVGSGGTLAGVGNGAQGAQSRHQDRAQRSHGIGAVQLGDQGRAQVRGQLGHRGHRPRPRHQEPRRRADRYRLPDHRRGGPAGSVRPDRT